MKQWAIIAAVSSAFAFTAIAPAGAQTKFLKRPPAAKPECFCTDRYGSRHEIGDIICLTVNSRSYEAKCIMAQNNPFWRDLERGCLSSKPAKPISPFNPEVATLYN